MSLPNSLTILTGRSKMNSETDESAIGRLCRNTIVVENILSNLSRSDIVPSRKISHEFNRQGRRLIPRCIDQKEWEPRLQETLGSSAESDAVMQYHDPSRPPTRGDLNVLAISVDPGHPSHSLPWIMRVYPNLETFYADGATIERITDRLWIMHSNMREPGSRTSLIDKLTSGFLSDRALSHCPEIQPGSKLSHRNIPRLKRLMERDDMRGSLYYRCTIVEPVHGPPYHLGEDQAPTYSIGAFSRLMHAHASQSWGLGHSIETIEYAPHTRDRLSIYRKIARQQQPASCHGKTTVIISSPDHAPNYFDLISDAEFPGRLNNMKHLTIDASLGPAPRDVLNISQAYLSPHLESVTFRLQHPPFEDAASDIAWKELEGASGEAIGERHRLPNDLARPFYGSTARVIYAPGPNSHHLADLCTRATLDYASSQVSGLDEADSR